MTLEERFKQFLSGLKNAEDIDSIPLPPDKKNNRIADYFLNNRTVILELKTLTEDSEHKIEETLEPHKTRDDYPIVFGRVGLNQVLAKLPDGEAINEQIYGRITRSIQKAFKSANEQIHSTRDSFDVQNAIGVLTILNEDIDVFSPEIIAYKIREMLLKRKEDETFLYDQIASVMIINESHYLKLDNGMDGLPIIVIHGPYAEDYQNIDDVMNNIMNAWSAFVGIPIFINEKPDLEKMDFKPWLRGRKTK